MQYIQTYFESFRDAGISTMFEIHRMQGDKLVERIPFDHVTHDGISAVLEIARKFPEDGFTSPNLTVKPKPSLQKRLKEMLKWYVRFYPFMPSKWKTFGHHQTDVVSAVIEVENWQSSTQNISVNTLLLFALDITSKEFLMSSTKARVWMTPVGIYNGIQRNLEASNRVSFIDIKIKNDSTLQSIQDEAKRQLIDLNYWGTMLTMRASVFFGKRFFSFFSKYMHFFFRRTGTFSNMGEWSIPGIPANEWWVFGRGCVAKMSPVEGTAMIVNGRLGLSIHFDSSLEMSSEEAQTFVKRWKENYLLLKSKA